MQNSQVTEEKLRSLKKWAEWLGAEAAKRAYGPEGPGLDVTLSDMEDVVVQLQRSFAKGAYQEMTRRQGEHFGPTAPCPECGFESGVQKAEGAEGEPAQESQRKVIQTRGGPFELAELRYYCRRCRRSFFPSASGTSDR